MPGPTWPNRFFVHGASSAGMDRSPTTKEEIVWELADGFTYGNGSIFDRLDEAECPWRLYQDLDNQFSDHPSGPEFGGWISQVASLKGVSLFDINSLGRFRDDLNATMDGAAAYLRFPYTFIEPNFGRSFSPNRTAITVRPTRAVPHSILKTIPSEARTDQIRLRTDPQLAGLEHQPLDNRL